MRAIAQAQQAPSSRQRVGLSKLRPADYQCCAQWISTDAKRGRETETEAVGSGHKGCGWSVLPLFFFSFPLSLSLSLVTSRVTSALPLSLSTALPATVFTHCPSRRLAVQLSG